MIRTSFHKDLTGTTFGITWMQFEKLFLEFQRVELHFNHWWCFISLSDRLFLLPCFPTFMITYDRKCQTAKAGLETWNPAMKQFLMIQPWSYSMPYFVTMKSTIRFVQHTHQQKKNMIANGQNHSCRTIYTSDPCILCILTVSWAAPWIYSPPPVELSLPLL